MPLKTTTTKPNRPLQHLLRLLMYLARSGITYWPCTVRTELRQPAAHRWRT